MGLDRWPSIAEELKNAPGPNNVMLAMSPQRTLVINGLHLTSGYDRTKEAQIQAAMVPADAEEAWVYGVGMGDTITQLLMRETTKKLHVVIPSRSIAKAAFQFDRHGWLDSPRVELHLAKDVGMKEPFCCSPVEVRFADDDAVHVRDKIAIALNVEFNEFNMAARYEVEMAQLRENKAQIDASFPLKALTDSYTQKAAIIVGGGPSLSGFYDWIKTRQESNAVVIAASTALWPLMRAGVVPDVVVCIDPAPVMTKHFRGLDLDKLSGTWLLYIPTVYPEVVARWKGPKVCANVNLRDDSDLYCGGSVVHSATDLGVKIGCTEVFLVGVDLSYPGGVSHADGAKNPYLVTGPTQQWRTKTKNGLGEEVITDEALQQYRVKMEEYIARKPDVSFYKLGRQGVTIKGAEWFDV